jgi:hypothetical protein
MFPRPQTSCPPCLNVGSQTEKTEIDTELSNFPFSRSQGASVDILPDAFDLPGSDLVTDALLYFDFKHDIQQYLAGTWPSLEIITCTAS